MVALIIFLVVAIPILGILVWLMLDEAFVRIEPGQLGLVVIRGKASDRSLDPGPHFVPRFWRMRVVVYPSLELSFRSGDRPSAATDDSALERSGPPLRVVLGDRTTLDLSYTVRFRVDPAALKSIHERFGPNGIWSAVRDNTARSVRATLTDPTVGIDDFFGDSRRAVESALGDAVAASLADDGFVMTLFSLGDLDLGRTGQVIQATVRARLELERERAEAATRLAEVKADAELGEYLGQSAPDTALRYRELGVWRDVISSPLGAAIMSTNPTRPRGRTAAIGRLDEGAAESGDAKGADAASDQA